MSDIVERLRERPWRHGGETELGAKERRQKEREEAADTITDLRSEVERLRAAHIETYYARQIEWSRETFGPALRTKGVIDHITKELREIADNPHDLSEWVDVIILAMDGFWRHGGKAEDLMPALLAKQYKNMSRTWPDWRTRNEDSAIEHDRSKDMVLQDYRRSINAIRTAVNTREKT